MCSRLWQWGESILEPNLRLEMQGKKGCISLEQNTTHLKLGIIYWGQTGRPWPCWGGVCCVITEEFWGIVWQLVPNGARLILPPSFPSHPPCSKHCWELGQWRTWHRALGIHLIGINCVTRPLNGHFKLLFLGESGQVLKIISRFC